MAQTYWYTSWERYGGQLLTARVGGPARATATLGIDVSLPAGSASGSAAFEVPGPGDVSGLRPDALRRRVPAAGQRDGEEQYAAYIELSAPDLPWRYSPEGPDPRPWIVLVVGTPAEVLIHPDGRHARLADLGFGQAPRAALLWDLATSRTTAHVQHTVAPATEGAAVEGDHVTARLLCPRDLLPDHDYVAAVVPAFAPDGRDRWSAGAVTVDDIPVYGSWRFRTGEQGSFSTLALALRAAPDHPLGRLTLQIDGAPDVSIRGALTLPGDVDEPLDPANAAALSGLLAPRMAGRRRVVGPPRYGDGWADVDPAVATWARTVNLDPRHRAVAGLGLHAGVLLQEEIVSAATDRAGDTAVAAHRIRALALGNAAAAAHWRCRLPRDDRGKLAVLGPSAARVMVAAADGTDAGSLLAAVTAETPLPAGLLSSAARRLLRPGTALRRGVTTPPEAFDAALQDAAAAPPRSSRRPEEEGDGTDPAALDGQVHGDLLARESGLGDGDGLLVSILERIGHSRFAETGLSGQLAAEREAGEPSGPRWRRVDLDRLGATLGAAFDPTGDGAVAVVRVTGALEGLTPPLTAPPEPCLPLDLPGWRILRDHAPTWLLPRAELLAEGEVAALVTNQRFVEAFLLGLNTQARGELRWRGIPLASDCTPLRRFWDRLVGDPPAEEADIAGVHAGTWPPASDLGEHPPDPPPVPRLVLAFRTTLFRRYPSTLVRLASARHPDVPGNPVLFDRGARADAARREPVVQAQVSRDLTLVGFDVGAEALDESWVVVEQVPRALMFRPDRLTAPERPLRVFLSGPSLRQQA